MLYFFFFYYNVQYNVDEYLLIYLLIQLRKYLLRICYVICIMDIMENNIDVVFILKNLQIYEGDRIKKFDYILR